MMPIRFLLLLVLLLLTPFAAVLAAPFPSPPPQSPDTGVFDFTARQTGAWNAPLTWTASATGPIPGAASRVRIPSGFIVTVQRIEPISHRFIAVEGELKLWIQSSTRLTVETLYVAPTGSLKIGDVNNPVKPGFKAEIVFTGGSAIDLGWDVKQMSRGLVADGAVKIFGQDKGHMITLAGDAPAGSTFIDLSSLPTAVGTNWAVGDEIVIAGTYFQRINGPAATTTSSQDERRTITSFGPGNRVNFASALAFDHTRVDTAMKIHAVNLSRNLVLSSALLSPVSNRGHVMLMNRDIDIRNVAFVGLGRTDKSIPLNDLKVLQTPSSPVTTPPTYVAYTIEVPAPSAITNRRGRYALHVHKNGILQPIPTTPPSKVYDSVVVDTPGWGFVNHSSHVDFKRNVAYNFGGAGFVTEAGDELGNFDDNVAIRGRGNGEYRPIRIVFQNQQRPQPLGDFAFSGDGFWFQGPALRVRNNVASGCDGAGMIWFTTGAPDPEQLFDHENTGMIHNRYSHFPRGNVTPVYGTLAGFLPRYWDHSDLVAKEKLLVSDLPILEMDGFDAYGNLVGFRLRFNNHDNVDWYTDGPFDYENHIVPVCQLPSNRCATRMRQAIKNLRLWNNEQAFRKRYVTKTDWSVVKAVNRLAYADNKATPDLYVGHAGAEINFQILDSKFTNLTIDGYPVAGWIEDDNTNVRNQITFVNPKVYAGYANFDIWNRSLDSSCSTPINPFHSLVTATTARLSWSAGSSNSRYLVRYKATNKQPWTYVQATVSPLNLSGLTSGSTYNYQVLAGCTIGASQGLSQWTLAGTFTTP